MTKVSIAMTTYCGEQFVEKQLQSLLDQSRQADQVVICDDHSNDNTAQIVASFIKRNCLSNWLFLVNEKNLGYKKNFKKAISLTDGDLIFLSDQDDIWLSDKIEKMEKFFLENPDCKSLNTSFFYIDQQGVEIPVEKKSGMGNNNLIKKEVPQGSIVPIGFAEIASYNISPGCTMAFTREIAGAFLDKTQSVAVHDWEINLVSSLFDGCYFYNIPTIKYRIHSNNAVGIPGISEGDGTSRGDYSHRLKIAKLMREYTDSFGVYLDLLDNEKIKILRRQIDFVKKRESGLESKSVLKVLSLNKYRKNYKNSVTAMGRLADIACVIKK